MKQFITVLCCFLLFTISCSDDDKKTVSSNCDKQAIVFNDDNFQDIITANYMITNVVLNDDCLSVTVSSSGCNGETWDMELISSTSILESFPVQRLVKVELDNEEACLAVFQKTVSFDLAPFQVDGQNQVILNIDGWDEPITYQY
ncbi:MAG: hypothetical protein O9282_06765 [Flavobacterium sp.]|jgi:hypothetical protein|uniref:hypothetical protein n=1 Tax=Flavobacterium sp. TaxID=239 RepID=UPI0022C63AE7|nr:hypothetical protein [Flavobacterium sp.]MCZ8089493.1 hypothetical protein [Flavobacterium sp.]MCZ8330995.1 hypothetical protein [Flavobacterium sp.]